MSPPKGGLREGRRYALKFISGKYEGGVFKLPREGEVFIGRASNVDIVIVEDMVSRKHARIFQDDSRSIVLEDLGSTNGSFVNGERITRKVLVEGDRILIGTSILKVMTVEDRPLDKRTMPISDLTLAPPDEAIPGERTTTSSIKSMEGLLSEVPLTDLLQMFSASQKTGVLTLRLGNDKGSIYMKGGRIVFASFDGREAMSPHKAIYRMLSWNEGHFEMGAYVEPPADAQEFQESVQMLLMEGLRLLDERRVIVDRLGLSGAMLRARFPLVRPLKDLKSDELDVFQFLMQETTYEDILDRVSHDDLRTTEILEVLLKGEYICKG